MDERIKRIRELLSQIETHIKKAAAVAAEKDFDPEAAAAELDKAAELQKQVDVLQRLVDAEKAAVPEPKAEEKEAEVNGFKIMAKLIRGRALTSKELKAIAISEEDAAELEKSPQSLISGTNATHGENYLCPQDVVLQIREIRKTYIQARDYITVEPTTALSGSVNFGTDPNAGLVAFDDGDTLDDNSAPDISKKTFTIKFYGAFIPVSQILEDAEKANLVSYLNRWFVKRAVITENTKIFTVLKAGYNSGTPKAITGADGLRSSINTDLDPSCLIGGFILTNQSGFDCLDKEVDGEGRHVLQQDFTNPAIFRFRGMPVVPFPDAILANIDSTHFPIFYGDTKAGAIMKLYKNLLMATSAHVNFTKAQTLLRVIEGFDVISADTSAYIYGSLTASA